MKRLVVLIFLLVGFGAACADSQSAETVSFMVFGDPAEREAYETLVAAFEEQNPDVDVAITHIPSGSEYRTRLTTEFAAGDPPDVSLMNYRRYAAFAAADLLEPLTPYLEKANSSTRKISILSRWKASAGAMIYSAYRKISPVLSSTTTRICLTRPACPIRQTIGRGTIFWQRPRH